MKRKRSNLIIHIPGNPQKEGDAKLFYKGKVVLEKFTNDMIVVSFIGTGFPKGINPKSPRHKDKLFPMEGKIIIEKYNIYDNK